MNGNCYSADGVNPTLTTNKGEGGRIAIPVLTPERANKRQNGRRFKEDGEEAFTLTGQDRHGVAVEVREATKRGYSVARGGARCGQLLNSEKQDKERKSRNRHGEHT